jgi:hypothetical protein
MLRIFCRSVQQIFLKTKKMHRAVQRIFLLLLLCGTSMKSYCWGFYAHQRINELAVFLLPPEMLLLFKPNIGFLSEHAVDPDKRRYAVLEEGPRHYIDIDRYGAYPYAALPRSWKAAVEKFGEDSLMQHGIVPWHVQAMRYRLTDAFRRGDLTRILKTAAELGHYIADAHVPLHANSNHNGQFTNQKGIHGFWESRVPELLAENEFDFFIGKAAYITDTQAYIWNRVLESAQAADSVLLLEKELTALFPADRKFAFENRNGLLVRQYSADFTRAFNERLNGMVERRMRQSIHTIASFWYTAWVDAGQPDLGKLLHQPLSPEEKKEWDELNTQWRNTPAMLGRQEE